MNPAASLAKEIQAFFDAPKQALLVDRWRPELGSSRGRYERLIGMASGGIALPQQIVLSASPRHGSEKAKAWVHWPDRGPMHLARLEIGNPATTHNNSGRPRPAGVPPAVGSPHAHMWQHNRHLFINPANFKLAFAVEIPEDAHEWEEAVRWFLKACNVSLPPGQVIGLPRSDLLL